MFCVWEKGFKMRKRRIFARVSFYTQSLQANAVCKLEQVTIFFLLSSPLPIEAWLGGYVLDNRGTF
jgi:hypothetical protein